VDSDGNKSHINTCNTELNNMRYSLYIMKFEPISEFEIKKKYPQNTLK